MLTPGRPTPTNPWSVDREILRSVRTSPAFKYPISKTPLFLVERSEERSAASRIGATRGQSQEDLDLYREAARRLCDALGVGGNAYYDCVDHYRQVVPCPLPPDRRDLTAWEACIQRTVAEAE
jgi:hypothetical protein